MIVIEAVGDPNVMASRAFEQLYDLYYGVKGVDLWPLPAPRVRWKASPELPKEAWTGIYGLPVPEGVKELPEHGPLNGMTARLTTWTYGEVVELLYIGPYDEETPSVQRMQRFVEERGYVFTGLHEEEYLKGPGMVFTGNPDEYATILRYEIGPAEGSGFIDTSAEPADTTTELLEETAVDTVDVPVVEVE